MPPRLAADLHVHTIASGHAYSTITEICNVASSRGLEMVGISDHGPAMPGGPHVYNFSNLVILPRVISGVRVLRSAECNVIDATGNIDLPDRVLEILDIVQVGMHPLCGYEPGGVEENTSTLLKVMGSGKVHVIVHPCNPLYPLNYERIVSAAVESGVLIEVNNASFLHVRKGSEKNARIILREVKRKGAPIVVGSDAHDASLVGIFDEALRIIDEFGIREELIVNRNARTVIEFLRGKGKDIGV